MEGPMGVQDMASHQLRQRRGRTMMAMMALPRRRYAQGKALMSCL